MADDHGPGARRAFACERCSRRKQRCDRTVPTCRPCRQAQAACIASDREAAVVLGVDNEVTRKGHVTRLLDQIAALERRLDGPQSYGAPSDGTTTSRAAILESESSESFRDRDPQPLPAAATSAAASAGVSVAALRGPGQPSMTNLSLLSLSAMAEPCNRAGEFLEQLSISRIIAGVTEVYGGDPETASRVSSLWDGISSYLRHPAGATQRLYIAREDADKALSSYLDVVDVRFPRLPVSKVQLGIAAISSPDEGDYRQTLVRDPAHIFMAYAVIAIVPLVSDGFPIAQGSWISVHLLSKCLKILDKVFHQEDGVGIIQCLQLLVILAIHCPTAGSAWHLVGFAMNKCIALGYHREDPKVACSMPPAELHQRRWAFWGCYLLDVLVCAALRRPLSIEAACITTPIPSAEMILVLNGATLSTADQAPLESSTSSAARTGDRAKDEHHVHLIRYARLLAAIITDTPPYSNARMATSFPTDGGGFELFLGQALQWRSSSPLKSNTAFQNAYLLQTSLYNTMVLRIAVRDLLSRYDFAFSNEDEDNDDNGGNRLVARVRSKVFAGWQQEQDRVLHLKLPSTCEAVARSLNRTRMHGRAYLSFLTGYSALTMALACLYCLALHVRLAAARAAAGHGLDVSIGGGDCHVQANASTTQLPPPTSTRCGEAVWTASSVDAAGPETWPSWDSADLSHSPNTFPCAASSPGNSHTQQQQQQQQQQLDALLGIAASKLDVVGRQFPRMGVYRAIVLKMRSLLAALARQTLSGDGIRGSGTSDHVRAQYAAVRSCTRDIGPLHLRQLTAAVMHVATGQQQQQQQV
ncbi:hypothetical protein Micbo1qcDRAFT_210502 [Microdochium bolleyi]|uniref:Zn(2)-C6 fungal-type domain-containing protein n=1 Tax=Microdochium bolleyi TaxID=196109 RepID=A0A136IIE5_9PEZI|nr:hypothetical protein Micbo1qcDRAFT_210502 [Microdochium bolleyi]